MRRVPVVPVVLLFLLAACIETGPSPTAGPGDPLFSTPHNDGSSGGNPHFFFLGPLGSGATFSGVFDGGHAPEVEVWQLNAAGNPHTLHDAPGVASVVNGDDPRYQVQWRAGETGALVDTGYRVKVFVQPEGAFNPRMLLGYVDVAFGNPQAIAAKGWLHLGASPRTIPVQFRIEEGALLHALEDALLELCEDRKDENEVIDCDVAIGGPDEETELAVHNVGDGKDGRVAGHVRVQEGAASKKYAILFEHLSDKITGADIPPDQQFPFFLRVTVVDEEGNHQVDFNLFDDEGILIPGAYLAVCLEASVPFGQFLRIFRFFQGETTLVPTGFNTPECNGNTHGSTAPGSLRERMRHGLDRFAGLFVAQPLRALHGGLNTTTNRFSEFGVTEVLPDTFEVDADAFLRNGPPPARANLNEGANEGLHIHPSDQSRVVVQFDLTEIPLERVTKATLVMTIKDLGDWTGTEHVVDAHRLAQSFAEGNGRDRGYGPRDRTRGTGAGVTWNCAIDTDISNTAADCNGTSWAGGGAGSDPNALIPVTADGVVHFNSLTGEVSWRVTADVKEGGSAWLLKRRDESPSAGRVEYYSREGADAAGNSSRGPRLILEY